MKNQRLDTRKIRKQMQALGYVSFQVELNTYTPAWGRKHHRVTAWKTPLQGACDWVMGDGLTLQSAWNALLYHAQNGNLEFSGGKKPRKASKR